MFLDVLGFSQFAFGVPKNSQTASVNPQGMSSKYMFQAIPQSQGCSGLVEEKKMQEGNAVLSPFYHQII